MKPNRQKESTFLSDWYYNENEYVNGRIPRKHMSKGNGGRVYVGDVRVGKQQGWKKE